MKIIDKFLQEEKSFEKKDSVKCFVFDEDGKILLLRRHIDDAGGGNWDIPGGAIEKGENQIDALKREVFEETNLKIDDVKKITIKNFKIPECGVNSDMNIYKAKTDSTNVQLKAATWPGSHGRSEHSEYCWVSNKDEIENIEMIPQLKNILFRLIS